MPKIQSYDIVSPSPSDLIVVTDASDNNSTKNIRVDSLSSATAPNYYGAAYYALTTAHTQVVSTVDTWEASTVPLTLNIFSDGIELSSNTQHLLFEAGVPSSVFKLDVVATIGGANNQNIHLRVDINEVFVPGSEEDVTTSSGGDDVQIVSSSIFAGIGGQTIRVKFKNSTSNTDFDVKHVSFIVTQIN